MGYAKEHGMVDRGEKMTVRKEVDIDVDEMNQPEPAFLNDLPQPAPRAAPEPLSPVLLE